MAVTRINNNQISDASAGNSYLGINAAVKLQNYSVTATKLANNITYGSDLTITGNLTIQGNTTTVDTTYTTIEDPTILLASNQTGAPAVDIGFVGERGTSNNIAFVWDESASEFVTVYTSSAESNTTITITSYADLHTANANIGGNIVINGTTSLVGSVIGNVSLAGNITMGNVLTNGQVSAAGNVTGGNVNTGGQVVATANITGGNLLTSGIVSAASHIGSVVSVTGNVTGGNVTTGGQVSAAGNITSAANISGGNISTSGTFSASSLSASGNITGGNLVTGGIVTATGNITSSANVAGGNLLATTTVSAASHIGSIASLSGNVTGGNLLTGGLISATSTITSAANVIGSNLVASSNVFAVGGYFTGNVTVIGNLNATVGVVYANSGIFYGNAVTGNSAIFAGLPGFTPLGSNVVAQFAGNANSYSQINFENTSNGTAASTDFIATADNGTDSTNYLDMGINSSNFNDQVNYPGFGPNDSYVHNHGGNLILNPESSGKVIKFMVGGTANANVVANVTSTGITSGGTFSAAGNITSASNIAGGNLLATTTVSAASHIGSIASLSGNVTGGNLLTGGLISATSNITSAANVSGGNILSSALVQGVTVSASGNVIGGNVNTGGQVSATGNITSAANVAGGNLIATTLVSAPSHFGTIVSVTGNVTGGNILTGGAVLATGNVSATANVLGGNLVATTAVVTPTVIGTTVTVSSTGGLITLAPSSNVSVSSKNINNLAQPVQDNDAASKIYVDNMVSTQLSYHQAVVAATTGTLEIATGGTITYAQPNGAGNGVGATLTVSGGTFNLIDTANIQTANTRVLVKNQANAVLNGIYQWSNATVLTRTTDADSYGPSSADHLSLNDYFFVSNGNVNAGSAWIVDSPTGTITFGTSSIQFAQFSSSQTYSAGNGISLVGTVITAKTDNNTTAFDVGGNIIVKASANLTTPNIGAATGTSLSVTGNLTGAGANVSGNVSGGNILTAGIVSGASHIGSVVSVTGNITGGNLLTGGLISSTGNITSSANVAGGNLLTSGIVSAASHIGSVVSVSGNVTGGNILTGGLISSTGNITSSANVAGGNVIATTLVQGTTLSATGNVIGGNVTTAGQLSATGNITSAANIAGANLIATTLVSAPSHVGTIVSVTANITGGNILTGGLISATSSITSAANITGGNLLTSGIVSAASHIGSVVSVSGNVTGGNINSAANISATANVTASFYFGNGSQLTGVTASTSGFPVTAGTSNIAAATNGNIGFSIAGTSNVLTVASTGTFTTGVSSVTGNITGGNLLTGGLISATSNITGGNLNTGAQVVATGNITGGNLLTAGIVSAASHIGSVVSVSANITGGNLLTGGLISSTGNITSSANISGANVLGTNISASGNITGANVNTGGTGGLTLSGSNVNSNAARITINSADLDVDFAIDGDTLANVFYVDAGTGTASFGSSTQTTNSIVAFNASNSILFPVGNTAQRPGTGVTGMIRFNSTLNAVEVYDNSTWATVGTPAFTVISDQQFNGDGTTVAFVLSAAATTNSAIVSINGVVQIPTSAYSVSSTTLTFTEAPQTGDLIDVRVLTTTTSVTSISNSPGNAVVAVSPTSAQVDITGNLSVNNIINSGANGTGNIGNSTTYFNTVFAKATSAQYADLAEVYAADATYEPGTVLSFGGSKEVTLSSFASDARIAGVVSTNPSYVMNATLESEHTATVALTGRVPTFVSGPVAKGDMMVSGGNGRAVACATPVIGTVIGKALENHTGGDGVIEVVVGRL